MRTLAYKCPDCQRKLVPVEGAQVATQVVRRKCRGCGTRWQLVVVPVARTVGGQAAWFDVGTFTRLTTA